MDDTICKMRILSEEYWDFIVSKETGRGTVPVPQAQLCTQDTGVGYEVIYIDQAVAEPMNFDRFSYNAIPRCYALLDMEAMDQAGISQVQNYPTLELMGENVMIGFVDTGIDYRNTIFRNLDGSSRIAGIWDQTLQSGQPPEGLSYGSAYTREQISEALREENPLDIVPSQDTNGHGTFLASLAAGGGNVENQFLGAAPEATIGVVKLKPAKFYIREFYMIARDAICYQENDIMLGIRYLRDLAEANGLPLVLCIALGSSLGGHNGTTPLSIMLREYALSTNRIVVTGVGNEANQRHHYFGNMAPTSESREVEIRVGEGVEGFVMELWTDIPNLATLSLISPSGEQIPRISIKQGTNAVYRFLFEQTEVYIDYRILVEGNNSQLIFFRFMAPAPGIWRVLVEPLQIAGGDFHIWLPVKEFLSGEVYFLRPDPDITLTDPSVVEEGMTVAFYNGAENSIDINSGRGYTRSGRIKPDFATPGVGVTGALPENRYARRSGSSVSVGIAAGAAALLMEWILYHTGSTGVDTLQLKNLFILGAIQRPNTEYPNREWGYGTLNLYNTLKRFREI